ncbi:Mitogen-activated protein kinase-binding protein 1, partial [Fasciola gigantica]
PDEAGLTAHFALEHHLVGRHSQLDAAFTPNVCPPLTGGDSKPATARRRYLAVACQDRRLRIYNVTTGRPVRCYRGSFNEDGCLVRCTIDPTGSIVATSGSDKQLNLFHLLTGESIATLCGHSELALGLRFLPDLRRLVSVSSDSCIFVWRLSPVVTQHLSTRTTGLSKHTQSIGGYPAHSGEPVDNLHPVAPLRWPHCSRGPEDSQAEEEDENMTEASSWTNESSSVLSTAANTRQARTRQQVHNGRGLIMPDEDSEADLFTLDAEDLLPQVSLQESGFGDVHDGR